MPSIVQSRKVKQWRAYCTEEDCPADRRAGQAWSMSEARATRQAEIHDRYYHPELFFAGIGKQ